MAYITVDVEVSTDDVLDQLSDEDLREELRRREKKTAGGSDGVSERELLVRAYYDLRSNCPSQALREYFDRTIGRVC